MYNLELVTLLEKVLMKSYQMKNGEHAFHCPFCNHHKKKLHCWDCNKGGYKIGILLRKINAPQQIITDVLKLLDDYVGTKKQQEEVTKYDVSLPKCYKPLWEKTDDPLHKNAMYYLKKRGIGGKEILRYSIGYCSSNGYSNRIIVPSYDADGKLNYFIARDMFPNSSMKYKNPPMSKDTVAFELFINWNEPVILCEGVFDAIAGDEGEGGSYGGYIADFMDPELNSSLINSVDFALQSNGYNYGGPSYQYNVQTSGFGQDEYSKWFDRGTASDAL